CLGGEVESQEFRESPSAPDDGTKPAGAQEIVAHAVPFREARFARKVRLGVEKIDGRGAGRVVHAKGTSSQYLIEVPRAPAWNAGWRGADDGLDLGPRDGFEDPLQEQKIQGLTANCKRYVENRARKCLFHDNRGPDLTGDGMAGIKARIGRRNGPGGACSGIARLICTTPQSSVGAPPAYCTTASLPTTTPSRARVTGPGAFKPPVAQGGLVGPNPVP